MRFSMMPTFQTATTTSTPVPPLAARLSLLTVPQLQLPRYRAIAKSLVLIQESAPQLETLSNTVLADLALALAAQDTGVTTCTRLHTYTVQSITHVALVLVLCYVRVRTMDSSDAYA